MPYLRSKHKKAWPRGVMIDVKVLAPPEQHHRPRDNNARARPTHSLSSEYYTSKGTQYFISVKMSMVVGDANPRDPKPTPNTPENVLQQFSLKGKVVAVNGASGTVDCYSLTMCNYLTAYADGIGLAVAEAMCEAGADVAFWYNSNDAAISKAKALAEKHGVKTKAYQVQVTDYQKVDEAMNEVAKDFGKLDVFVANAGAALSKGLLDMSMEEIKKITSVNCPYHHVLLHQSLTDAD